MGSNEAPCNRIDDAKAVNTDLGRSDDTHSRKGHADEIGPHIKINLASPEDIRSWSFGEVKKPETINYRTHRPEKDGIALRTDLRTREELGVLLRQVSGHEVRGQDLRSLRRDDRKQLRPSQADGPHRAGRAGRAHLVLQSHAQPPRHPAGHEDHEPEKDHLFPELCRHPPGDTPLKPQQLLTEDEYREAREQYGEGSFDADIGGEAIRKLLMEFDLVKLSQELRDRLAETASKQKKKDLINRLKIVEAIRDSDNRPEWMVLDAIPVIPPDLRPLVLLDAGDLATSNLNELYCRIINRNNQLKRLIT